MGSVGPLSSPGTIVVITVAYVLFSTHVWIARAQIANQLKSWGRDYPKKITELVQRIILQIPSSRQSKSKSARSSRREKRMKEAAKLQQTAFERSRVAACSSFLITVCPWVALTLFIRVSLLLVLGVPVNENLAVIIPLYSLTLLASSGVLKITNVVLDIIGLCCHAVMFVTVFFIPGPPTVLLMAPGRCLARAVFGLVFVNTKLTALCNIPIFFANIYRLREASNIFRTTAGGEQDPDYFALAIVSELTCFMGIVCLASVIQKLFQEKIKDAMVAADMEHSLHSKGKLLSVLCDAHVKLGHDFRILGRCTELSQMLMTGFGPNSTGLEGTVFTTLLAEIDQTRFHNFMAVSAMQDGNENDDDDDQSSDTSRSSRGSRPRLVRISKPATSLHVNIRDAAGVRFPIELFHVEVCNMRNPSEPPSHLIGIREQPGGHEISTSFQRLGSISEVPGAAVGEAHVTAPGAAEPPTQVLSDLLLQKATGSRSSQASCDCKASSATGSSTQGSRAVQQPSIQRIEFQFDGMADGFPLQHAKIYFDSPATTESSTSPMMKDWLLESMWPRFRVWVQNAINEGMAGRGDTFNPTESAVALLWPGQADTVLCADEVQFRVEELEETEDLQAKKQKTSQASPYTESTEQEEEADGEEEEVKSVAIWATMRGFHQHRNPEKKRSSRTAQSKHQAPTLAAIQEHDRRMFRASNHDMLENKPR
ncbi:unnamed protein product [Polarella glacialis]|uniref:Uncharacterized protein n=1 Tax=Polarella glacialis TaxID=89957 RepID=A0A813D7D7_POLGL|nr:unnamed protein product [Polarella glacialis]